MEPDALAAVAEIATCGPIAVSLLALRTTCLTRLGDRYETSTPVTAPVTEAWGLGLFDT